MRRIIGRQKLREYFQEGLIKPKIKSKKSKKIAKIMPKKQKQSS